MAMGLGGAIAIGTTAEAFENTKQYWRDQGHQLIEIEPSGAATVIRLPVSAGLEEADLGLKESPLVKQVLVERGGLPLPAASEQEAVIGVVAGPVGGWSFGYALEKLTPAVAYVVNTRAEAEDLMATLGIGPEVIYVAEELGGLEKAGDKAQRMLEEVWQISRVERLGVDKPVSGTIQLILHNLFGIELNSQDWAPWAAFISRIEKALAQAVSA